MTISYFKFYKRNKYPTINNSLLLAVCKITADGGYSHEIRKHLLFGRSYDQLQFTSVQSLSHVRLFATPWITAHLSITNSWNSLKFMLIELVMPSSHLNLCRPLLPDSNPSQHQGLFQESTLRMSWPKYWSFSFSISTSKEHPGLISFRMDWLDLCAVQRALKSLLQHHSSQASISSKFSPLYGPTLTSISLVAQTVKASACNVGDPGSIPGSGRSPDKGNGNPLQYSCLENSIDGETS